MAQQNRTTLKGYFETDDVPDEGEFIDLIDSVINIAEDGILVGAEDNITAFATGGQANAYQLTKKNNHISVCATISDSVKLPSAVVGMVIHVFNSGAQVCDVYPTAGEYIHAQAVNVPLTIGHPVSYTYFCYATGKWGVNK